MILRPNKGGEMRIESMAGRTGRRTFIEPHKRDKRFVRRNQNGRCETQVNLARSLATHRRHKANTKAPRGSETAGTDVTFDVGWVVRLC
jgi:hypothetical protein